MAAKVLIVTLLIAATLTLGEALHCQLCVGSKLSDCHQNYQPSIAGQECFEIDYSKTVVSRIVPLNIDNLRDKVEARCVVLYTKDDGYVQDATVKGCSYALNGTEPCDFVAEGSSCYSCKDDYCNV